MKLAYSKTALEALQRIPARIRKAFYKQAGFLLNDLHHPSLRAKKYSEAEDKWQARVNKGWRFYFNPTFALPRVSAAQPNYIWFVCNNDHLKKARKGPYEDPPSFL
jgi:mRNA interferase RelE/StbE